MIDKELYASLTQAERIVWDLANCEPFVAPEEEPYKCHFCDIEPPKEEETGYTLVYTPACYEPEAHHPGCLFRRAVEWKREMEARG